jgi:hypothetical protein
VIASLVRPPLLIIATSPASPLISTSTNESFLNFSIPLFDSSAENVIFPFFF